MPKTGAEAAKEGIKRRFGSKGASTGKHADDCRKNDLIVWTASAAEDGSAIKDITDECADHNAGVYGGRRAAAHLQQNYRQLIIYKCRNL